MVSNINSTLGSGVSGISAGIQRAQEAADDIANLSREEANLRANPDAPATNTVNRGEQPQAITQDAPPSLEESLVDLKVAENQVAASAQVVKTADETIGTLIDTVA